MKLSNSQTLGDTRQVDSLFFAGGRLTLGGNRIMWIRSGGILSSYGSNGNNNIINGIGLIHTTNGRPFYVHTFTGLSLQGSARFASSSEGRKDLVKGQEGSLILDSNATHQLNNIYIHRGVMELKQGTLRLGPPPATGSVRPLAGRIVIGDGAGDATLKLAPDRWD